MTPALGRAVLTWAVFIVLLSGVGLLVSPPGSAGFVLSGLMFAAGALCGAVLLVVLSRRFRDRTGGTGSGGESG
jgi:hypothetical protein